MPVSGVSPIQDLKLKHMYPFPLSSPLSWTNANFCLNAWLDTAPRNSSVAAGIVLFSAAAAWGSESSNVSLQPLQKRLCYWKSLESLPCCTTLGKSFPLSPLLFQPSPPICLVTIHCKIIRAGLYLSQTWTQAWKQDKTDFWLKKCGREWWIQNPGMFWSFLLWEFHKKTVFPTSLPMCGKTFIKLFHIFNIWEFRVSLNCLFPTLTQHRERGGKWGKMIKLKNNVGGRQNLMFPFNALELSKDEEVMKGWSSN